MQSSGATAARFQEPVVETGEYVRVSGTEARQLSNFLTPGARVEIKFHADYNPEHLHYLMDLRSRSAVKLCGDFTMRFITVALSSVDQSRRSSMPIVLELTEEFFRWPTPRNTFFERLCPKLEYVRLLPD